MMKAPKINPELVMYGVGGAVLLYVLYKGSKAVGHAVGAVVDGANSVATNTVGAVGSIFGLTSPSQTIDDPVQVRRILDTEGWFAASEKGTAMAFLKALQLPPTNASPNAGTSVSTRTVDPTGGTFSEGSAPGGWGALDIFDPRYYGAQNNTILQAETNAAGPGGAGQAVGSLGTSSQFFSSSNPLGNLNGM